MTTFALLRAAAGVAQVVRSALVRHHAMHNEIGVRMALGPTSSEILVHFGKRAWR
jgi:hypothetical protein